MASKLVIVSIVLIAAGLVLAVYGNPSLRSVTGASAPVRFTNSTSTFTFTRTGTFSFNGTFPGNFTRGVGATSVSSQLSTDEVTSLAGVALVAAGLLLEVFSVFLRPRPAIAPRAEV